MVEAQAVSVYYTNLVFLSHSQLSVLRLVHTHSESSFLTLGLVRIHLVLYWPSKNENTVQELLYCEHDRPKTTYTR